MKRFHLWARRWLWTWALMLAVTLVVAWLVGSWHGATNIVRSILFALGAAYFCWLIVAGWIEWRQRNNGDEQP